MKVITLKLAIIHKYIQLEGFFKILLQILTISIDFYAFNPFQLLMYNVLKHLQAHIRVLRVTHIIILI